MTYVKIPFGIKDGKTVLIDDIPVNLRGKACGCYCPLCEAPLVARLGDKRVHHFAHSGEGCDEEIAFMCGLYLQLQEYVKSHVIYLPALKIYWTPYDTPYTKENLNERISFVEKFGRNDRSIIPIREKHYRFKTAEVISRGKQPIALKLIDNAKEMVVVVKPPPSTCKTYQSKPYEQFATLQLDASEINFSKLKKEQVFMLFEEQFVKAAWLFSPKAEKALDEINKENDELIKKKREFIEKQKEQEKRAKEQEALRKREQDRRLEQIRMKILSDERERIENEKKRRELEKQEREQRLERGKREVADRFTQQDEIIYDSFGQRWVKCEICGEIKPKELFNDYGGRNRNNTGICTNCSRGIES